MDESEKKWRKSNLLADLCILLPCLIFGICMLLFPGANMTPLEVEKAGTYFVQSIWGMPAGLTFLVFTLIWGIVTLKRYKAGYKPKTPSLARTIFGISSFITGVTAIIYAIIILQSVLCDNKALPLKFSFSDDEMGNIHMVCIMFIICFGIPALITGIKLRKKKIVYT